MDFDNILLNGCSWVQFPYDWNLEERHRTTDMDIVIDEYQAMKYCFGKLLVDKYGEYNVKYWNLAKTGNSNDKIFYTTWEHIMKKNLKNSLVIIGLTEISRFFVHGPQTSFHFVRRPVIKPTVIRGGIKLGISDNDLKTFHEVKVKLTNDEMKCEEIIMMCDLLEGFLKTRDSKLLVFNSFARDIEYMGRDYFYKGFNTWGEYIESYDDEYIFNLHPNAYDHKIFADDLYRYLKVQKKENLQELRRLMTNE